MPPLDSIKDALARDLGRGLIPPSALLSRCRVISESSRATAAYSDPAYVPFYFYLGRHAKPKYILEIGFGLGLFSAAILRGCGGVAEHLLAFQQAGEIPYSPRSGVANVRDCYKGAFDVHVGGMDDASFAAKMASREWDVVVLNGGRSYDEHLKYLYAAWPQTALGGFIVAECVATHIHAKRAFSDLCAAKNRDPVYFRTRYGTGIVQK